MNTGAQLEYAKVGQVEIEWISKFFSLFWVFLLFFLLLRGLGNEVELEDQVYGLLLTKLCFFFALKEGVL